MFELTRLRSQRILAVGGVLALALGMLGWTLFDKVQGGGFTDPKGEAGRATELLRDTFGQAPPKLVLLVRTAESVDDPEIATDATALVDRLKSEPNVAGVASYWTDGKTPALRSTDGHHGLIVAGIRGDEAAVGERVGGIADRFGGTHGSIDVQVSGSAMLLRETVAQSEQDAVLGAAIVFPVTLIVLLFVFGGLVAAILPLVVALITVLLALGALWLIAVFTALSATAATVAAMLGFGLAIHYSLLVISRYRGELVAGTRPAAAVAATLRSVGRTVGFSAGTVAVALSGLLFFPLLAMRSAGYAGIVVALIAAAVSLIVLPALLMLLGTRIDRGQLRWFRRAARPGAGVGTWHRLARFVMLRPVPIGLAVTALLVLLATPFLSVKLGLPDERSLPESMSSRQVAEIIHDDFAVTEQDGLFAVLPDSAYSAAGLDAYARKLSEVDNVGRVDTATGSYSHGGLVAAPTEEHQRFRAVAAAYRAQLDEVRPQHRAGRSEGEAAAYLTIVPDTADPALRDAIVTGVRAVPAASPVLVGGVAADNADAASVWTRPCPPVR